MLDSEFDELGLPPETNVGTAPAPGGWVPVGKEGIWRLFGSGVED